MAAAVLGPAMTFSNRRHLDERELYVWEGHSRRQWDIDIFARDGSTRLRYRTVQKYLPRLWDTFVDGIVGHVRQHGRPSIDIEQLHDTSDHVVQACLVQIVRHLKELERTDGNASSLLDWLEDIWRRARRNPSYRRRHNERMKLTRYFAGLGRALDYHEWLGSHRKLFQIMANFLIKNCYQIFRRVSVEEFLQYIYALDRQGHEMSEVLATILTSIGRNGRRRLRHYDHHPASVYHKLSSRTRRALWKLDDAKRHRYGQHHRRVILPYRDGGVGLTNDLGRFGGGGRRGVGGMGRAKFGVIPRHQKNELLRRYGDQVRFQDWAPSDYTFYRILSYRPRLLDDHRHHRPHHHREHYRPRRISSRSHYGLSPYKTDYCSASNDHDYHDDDSYDDDSYDDEDDDDDDDETILATDIVDDDDDDDDDDYDDYDDYDLAPDPYQDIYRGRGINHARQHHHQQHQRTVPRRVSYGNLTDSFMNNPDLTDYYHYYDDSHHHGSHGQGRGEYRDLDLASDVFLHDRDRRDHRDYGGLDDHQHLPLPRRNTTFRSTTTYPRRSSWGYHS